MKNVLNILTELRADPNNLPLLQSLDFGYMHTDSPQSNRQKNTIRRDLIRMLYQSYTSDDRQLIRVLLGQEIIHCENIDQSTDNLLQLLFMLYTLKHPQDLKIFYNVKFILGINISRAVDINLLFGLGHQAILDLNENFQQYFDHAKVIPTEEFYQNQKNKWNLDLLENPLNEPVNNTSKEVDQIIFEPGDVLTFQFSDGKTGAVIIAQRYETYQGVNYILYPTNSYHSSHKLSTNKIQIYSRQIKAVRIEDLFDNPQQQAGLPIFIEKSATPLLVGLSVSEPTLNTFEYQFTKKTTIPKILNQHIHYLGFVRDWKNFEMHMKNLVLGSYAGFTEVYAEDFKREEPNK